MTNPVSKKDFTPESPDAAGVLSWVHIGDLHMTRVGERNDIDLQAIVEDINAVFAGSISFVYLPGDVADDGSRAAYAVVRQSLDRLKVPWCAIVGDHDVHEKSFANFIGTMGAATHYAFTVGKVRFVALNAFDIPDPGSFAVLPEQMQWIEQQLHEASEQGQNTILLLHCYPSDLKSGREQLIELARKHDVRLIDMGHTHYNEIGNDGRTLYTATRSTGQIEEGPVGFSVTNIDNGIVSWRFLELGELPAVVITSPSDERLLTKSDQIGGTAEESLRLRAKVWGHATITHVQASFERQDVQLRQVPGSRVWEGDLPTAAVPDGIYPLLVTAEDVNGKRAVDSIRVLIGTAAVPPRKRFERDQDNALSAWAEHGLLGTQLGPNKNGKKW
jgi:predicted phosphodiesterase